MAGAWAGAGAGKWTNVEPEPKKNNFGSATLHTYFRLSCFSYSPFFFFPFFLSIFLRNSLWPSTQKGLSRSGREGIRVLAKVKQAKSKEEKNWNFRKKFLNVTSNYFGIGKQTASIMGKFYFCVICNLATPGDSKKFQFHKRCSLWWFKYESRLLHHALFCNNDFW